jgi:hypothetical protein
MAAEDNFSVLVIDWLPFYFANFTDRNDRQHGKDRKSYHHRATPHSDWRDVMESTKVFRAQKIPIAIKV